MRINYEAKDRKRMVKAIGEALDEKPIYQGVPSCAYQIEEFTVTRDGNLEFPDDTDPEIINGLLDALEEAGFAFPEDEADTVSLDTEVSTDENGSVTTEGGAEELDLLETPTELTISQPIMESSALDRLQKLIDSKASLIQKALNITDQLTIQIDGDKVSFPWWKHMSTPDEAAAYMAFLAALCRMARDAKRVIATEKPVESEKYSFRIFLIRLGFNGKENAAVRKTLLHRLPGKVKMQEGTTNNVFTETQVNSGNNAVGSAWTLKQTGEMKTIVVTNTLTEISPTGYVSRFAPYALILVGGIVLLVIAMKRKGRKEEE